MIRHSQTATERRAALCYYNIGRHSKPSMMSFLLRFKAF